MKQITVISGKGGTGKTTLTSAFASLAENAVISDCDVDAADIYLILNPEIMETFDFIGSKVAYVNNNLCTECGLCKSYCRFDAITEDFNVNTFICEGCGVCEYICPENAISLNDRISGKYYKSRTRYGPMSHANLKAGEEASGKLVTVVRNTSSELVEKYNSDLILIDGPPGTGCSVISSITGVNMTLVVTEPSISGIHDFKRILEVTNYFDIPTLVCINKYDINVENTRVIEDYCREKGVEVVGKIPYDTIPVEAMIQEKTIIEYSDSELSRTIRDIWERVTQRL
ncbi:ATP-binding protein [Methanohalobium sp.]|uniref:ATP-binding protein n=1 Tax=Methanohalobium sp. TaxID=2837493 RepID=UPI0025DD2703|nr:P-loop NTPase [Methanohalobium sp.]